MTSTETVCTALCDRYESAMRSFDSDALAELYAEESVHEFGFFSPGPRVLHGREEVRAHYRRMWNEPSVTLGPLRRTWVYRGAGGESMAYGWVAEAVPNDGSAPFELHGVLEMETAGGRLVRVRDYMDVLGFAHGAGRLPTLMRALSA